MVDNNLIFKLIAEYELSERDHLLITELRNSCFEQYDRSYTKQLPHWRILAWQGDRLVGHVGIDHRMICVDSVPLRIFGLIDVCVAEAARSRGIGSQLIAEVESLARDSGADALLLMAQNHSLYLKNGFRLADNHVAWLRIHEYANFGVGFEHFNKVMMFKQLNDKPWGPGLVDLLGYMF